MKVEPRFLLESLSRWDFGWRLSQTQGPILMPVPQDFHSTVEALHHARQLSGGLGCILTVKVSPGPHEGPTGEKVFEIRHPASTNLAK
jgi:hypothetical protein